MPEKNLSSNLTASSSARMAGEAERTAALKIAFDLLRQFWPETHVVVSHPEDRGNTHAISLSGVPASEIAAFCFDSVMYSLAVLYHFTEDKYRQRVEDVVGNIAHSFSEDPDGAIREFHRIVAHLKPESLQ